MKHKIHLIPAVTFFLILFYTVVIRARPLTPGVVSNSFAIAATFIIGLCFLLGPLSRLKPHKFVPCLKYRKALGLCGYLFAAIHAAGAIVLEFNIIASGENLYSIISAIFAFIIFTVMTITSTGKAIQKMGYQKWKRLQRTGYIAFFLVLIHFTIIEKGVFVSRQLGQVLFAFVLLVLLIRILIILMGKKEAYKPEEFHEVHGIEKPE